MLYFYIIMDGLSHACFWLQAVTLLKCMNAAGVRDGVNQGLELSVDSLPLEVHLKKLKDIRNLV